MSDTIDVVWPSGRGYWDMALIDDIFSGKTWRPVNGFNFIHHEVMPPGSAFPPNGQGAVVVLPARHMVPRVLEMNVEFMAKPWILLMLIGDEESLFPIDDIQHPNIKKWVMTPRRGTNDHADRYLPNGYSGQTTEWIPKFKAEADQRRLDWFFAGQITHPRRRACAEQLREIRSTGRPCYLIESLLFTQGLDREDYFKNLCAAKIAPCPSGPETPDTFRLYEALEAGCIPIVDSQTSRPNYPDGFWEMMFPGAPFTQISDWSELPKLINQELAVWSEKSSRVQSWWMWYKRELAYALRDDIIELRSKA